MTIDLNNLQKLCEEATDFSIRLDQFRDAIDPDDVMALICIARLAKTLHTGVHTREAWEQMREALKGVEG